MWDQTTRHYWYFDTWYFEVRTRGSFALGSVGCAVSPARRIPCVYVLTNSMEAAAEGEVPAEVLRALFAHAGAALGGRGAASAARVSRAWRAAAGSDGVVRAALGSNDADERVRGCKVVSTAARAGPRADAHEGSAAVDAAAAEMKGTFDALLEALLRDGEARVRREAARALWVLSRGEVTPERAKAIAAALDGEALFTLEGHGDTVISVCFSPDGKQLATGSGDRTVQLWDVETGACVKTLQGHGDGVFSVCFSPDGRWLALGSADNTVRLWDMETGVCVRTLKGHGNSVWGNVVLVHSVCFSPDGRQLASGSSDDTLQLWDAETGACVKALEGHGDEVTSVCFSPDGRRLASGSYDATARLWLLV